MKNRKIIGVDFDDVTFSTNEAMCRYHNKKYGTNYQLSDVRLWDLSSLWRCEMEEVFLRWHEFYASPEHLLIAPVPGAVEALALLAQSAEVHIITARPLDFEEVTRKLLQQHAPFLNNIHFINKLGVKDGHHRTKAETCEELGVEVLVDDHLGYAEGVALRGIPVFLFNRPWNEEVIVLPQGVRRVHSWEEIVSLEI